MLPAKDHPRRCGENGLCEIGNISNFRITPAGAGKTLIAGILLDRIRITPAGAGKTLYVISIDLA